MRRGLTVVVLLVAVAGIALLLKLLLQDVKLDIPDEPPPPVTKESPPATKEPPPVAKEPPRAPKLLALPPRPTQFPGFVRIPMGKVWPGTTWANIKKRAAGNQVRLQAMAYERWGEPDHVVLPEFFIGRYEVTNAQWKHYLDKLHRKKHTTVGRDTLRGLAERYVGRTHARYAWKAIYTLNMNTIADAMVNAGTWDRTWGDRLQLTDAGKRGLPVTRLPSGIALTLYAARTPKHWYGWHELSGLNTGREYCEIRKKPAQAFKLPQGKFPRSRARDYAAHPIRYLSAKEITEFVEWAGGSLPSEYEWERAGRDDRPRENQHTFPGLWNRRIDVAAFAWVHNRACGQGPLSVEHASVSKGDGPFGTRHQLGNVYELTRTFFHYHPRIEQRPPPHALMGMALTAKGGSWGDGAHLLQLSVRTPVVGTADMDLAGGHRVDSLGFRMSLSPKPGLDALRHSIRRFCFNPVRGFWASAYSPASFALTHGAGIDSIDIRKAGSPYVHFRSRALAVAAAPLWVSKLSVEERNEPWPEGPARVMGIFRCDIPFRAGKKQMEPGEWLLVYAAGAVGLANRGMIKEATLTAEFLEAGDNGMEPGQVTLDDEGALRFSLTTGREGEGRVLGMAQADLWALSETLHPKWTGWPRRRASKKVWKLRFQVRVDLEDLQAREWNQ